MTHFLKGIFYTLLLACAPVHAQDISSLLGGAESENKATLAPAKQIDVEHTGQADRKIAQRLDLIYSELDELRQIQVSVSNGVVTLAGEAESKAAREKAVQLAGQVENIVEVEDKIEVSQSLSKRLQKTANKLITLGEQFIAALPMFLVAACILLLFWIAGGWLARRQSLYRRITSNYFIADLLGLAIQVAFVIVGLILALNLLDASALLGTILGAAGIFGLAIGFAVRDTVENFIASILLSIRNPFEAGDLVDIEGREGNVLKLTTRATILISLDGNHIRIPNAAVFKAVITNYSRHPQRRFQFDLNIANEEDLSTVQALVLQAVADLDGVLATPRPQAIVDQMGDSSVVLRIFCWVDQERHDLLKVRSETIKSAKQSLDEAGVAMPNPIYELIVSKKEKKETKPKPKAIKKAANEEEITDTTRGGAAGVSLSDQEMEDNDENLLNEDAQREG